MRAKGLSPTRAFVVLMLLLSVGSGSASFAQACGTSTGGTDHAKQTLQIPAGTILPVRLNHGLSSKNAMTGQEVTGRIMRDVPLPGRHRIPEGSKVLGKILAAEPASIHGGGRLMLWFDRIESHHRRWAIVTNLRALASTLDVQQAQEPEVSPGFGTPITWANTRQVGGNEVYGAGGPVTDTPGEDVGRALNMGVGALVRVRARPGRPCRGATEGTTEYQALWVFSSDASGVYGMQGTKTEHRGRTEPVGELVLSTASGDVRLGMGTGMALRITR